MALGWLNRVQDRATDLFSGLPLKSPTITVYLAGTNTLAQLFTSNTGATPLANPFLADVHGFYEFYPNAVRVDVQITPVCGSPYTLPDVQPLTPYYLTGADPTGAADSTAIFQQAANLGGLIIIPPGSYQITAPIVITNPVEFIGSGPGGYGQSVTPPIKYTNLFAAGANLATLDFFHVNSGGVTIRDLAFQGHGARQGAGLGSCIVQGTDGDQSFGNEYRNLLCSGHSIGIHIQNGTTWLIDHCDLSSYDAIVVENQGNVDSGDAFIRDCTLHATGIGGGPTGSCIKLLSGGGLKINQCKLLSCLYGLNISWFSGNSIAPLITQCSFEGFTLAGINVTAGTLLVDFLVHGNFLDMLANPSGPAILINTADLQGVVINSNIIRGMTPASAGVAAIDLQALDTFTVNGNTLQLQGGAVQYGIRVRNTAHNGVIGGNNIQGSTVAAVLVDAGATCNVAFQP